MSAWLLVKPPLGDCPMTYLTISNTSSPPALPFFFFSPVPMNRCLSLVLHPSIRMNSSNSRTLRLQHVYPLLPSWNIGTPGWNTHFSFSRFPVYDMSHAFRLQILPFGISRLASSSSDSGGGGGGVAVGWGAEMGPREASGVGVLVFNIGVALSDTSCPPCFFSICGGWSVVECLPVVQGGIERNSSKVRTRGLQHFQPDRFGFSFLCF